jgi:hypothetical protein
MIPAGRASGTMRTGGVTMRALRLMIALLLTAAPALAADPLAEFSATFEDATLRVDLQHIGNATEELYTLDRIYKQGIWAGSRVHLLDTFDNGRNYAKLYDAVSGRLLYSRGFDAYFGEYRTTEAAGAGVRRAYSETVLTPFPKKRARLAIEVRGRDGKLKEIASFDIDPSSWAIAREPLESGVLVIEAHRSGDPHGKVDVAILGEGYTLTEEAKFRADLARFTAILLGAEPYSAHRDEFNIWGVWKPSQDSGADEPSHGSFKNTVLGTTFDSLGSERYLLTEENRAMRDIAAHVPYDAIYIMVNSPRYGGGGLYNLYCTFTTDNQWHKYVFLHEFGHSFTGLADEYYTSSTAYNDFYPRGVEPTEPNITALLDSGNLKWKGLVTPGTAVPTPWEKAEYDAMDLAYQKIRSEENATIARMKRDGAPKAEVDAAQARSEKLSKEHADKVDAFLARSSFVGRVGAFEGAGYSSQGLYRPMLDCLMFTKGDKPLCKVCRSAVERVIAHYTE